MQKDKRGKNIKSNLHQNVRGKNLIEDTTEYGEFIPTFDVWITPEKQKEMAEYLEELGENMRGD